MANCTITNCDNTARIVRGVCNTHYIRLRRHGTTEPPVKREAIYRTETYKSWSHMKARCYNKNKDRYPIYGGRGIIVCDRWLNSFSNFYEDMGERPEGKTLDRINSNGNYEKSNCKWSTPMEQQRNLRTRSSNHSGYKGVTLVNGRWRVQITANYRNYYMGSYADITEAIGARLTSECLLWD